ncbi:hypothetical protein [Rhizorhabdus argentea]|uniref:hypothetical protein n=1 Tax=Rhizorhabdus argentea TaxID=1387174 RepID=UPI0030EF50B4
MIAKNMERAATAWRKAGIEGDRWIVRADIIELLRLGHEMDAPRLAEMGRELFFMGIPIDIGIPSDSAPFQLVARHHADMPGERDRL